jgi:predicted nucleic acid-binding protein
MILLDSNILVRLFEQGDPDWMTVNNAIRKLTRAGERFGIGLQNMTEFWNVTTRPKTARGGQGHDSATADQRLQNIERTFAVLSERSKTRHIWRSLVLQHQVTGKQVHDCRLTALMMTHGVRRILTFNTGDFARYDGIIVLDPRTV